MANLGTTLFTLFCGTFVGRDEFRNKYYRKRPARPEAREKRWVIFKGPDEATRIPPDWHAWVHHVTDKLPKSQTVKRQRWQKDHEPNKTGSSGAYRPPGHMLKGGHRAAATGDYQAWAPKD